MIYYLLEIYSGILNIRHISRFYYLIYNYNYRRIHENKTDWITKYRIPYHQGAMAWVSEATLVAAVANAGATGVIALGGRDAEWTRNEIRACKERNR